MSRHLPTSRRHLPLTLWSVVFLLLGAMVAGAMLWQLHRLQGRVAHVTATRTVLAQGENLTTFLAGLQGLALTNLTAAQWQLFNTLVEGLHAAQNELQFVSVTRDGETLFHRQTTGLAAATPPDSRGSAKPMPVSISSGNLELGGRAVPVMIFRRDIPQQDGSTVSVELGLQRSVVVGAEENAAQAIRALFRFSVLIVTAAFGLCLLLFVWVVRRDRQREAHARQEEHLAFSGVLANGIVHDFRNPMSSVRLDAQMLERELTRAGEARQDRLIELSGRISRTIERMDRVFQEFLYLARPAVETLEPVNLADCVSECLETLAPRLEQADVRVTRVGAPVPLFAAAAPFALRRALINILLNAIQFSPRGGQIDVTMRQESEHVILDVGDRGPGIAPQDRQRVFEMFVTSRPEGTGLGLFLARTAIRKCGGEITALGRDGGGTLIHMVLKGADCKT